MLIAHNVPCFFGIVVCNGDNDNDNDDNHNIVMMIIFPPWTWDPCFKVVDVLILHMSPADVISITLWWWWYWSMSLSSSTSLSQSSSSDIVIIIIDGIISIINHRCWHCRSLSQDHVHIQRLCLYFCAFSVVVFDTERCLWHRKMGLTQKDVFHTERCLWRRKMSLTQNDIFDTEICLWHKKMCLTQRDVNEEFTNLQKLLKVFRRCSCEFSLESFHVWMMIVSSLTILSYYPWTQEYPCITGAPPKCFIAFVHFVFADNCCQGDVE